MIKAGGPTIEKVTPDSPAASAGIKPGWQLLRIDNQQIGDIIDYKIMESDNQVRLLLMTDRGILRRVKITKPFATPLGLQFNPATIAKIQHCGNKCIFCFVDQNPAGMRSALYVKDDDYRLSFLYGNFITLNRLNEAELKRIINLQLSPLYVSVHTTNPELRSLLFGTKRAERGLQNLKRLVENGIKVQAQVVLCPGFNNGPELERTINDLAAMGPNLASTALVPVGLTDHRGGLENLRKFNAAESSDLLKQVSVWQQRFLKELRTRFVYAADEFYNLASAAIPADEEYEGYPQLENGVGLSRLFLKELAEIKEQENKSPGYALKITIAAGSAAETVLNELVKDFSNLKNISVNLEIIDNIYFGKQVTVSGLLTGSDLLAALEGEALGDVVFISDTMLKDGSNLFLDDLSIAEVAQTLKVPVCAVSGPLELLSRIEEIAGGFKSEEKGVQTIDR